MCVCINVIMGMCNCSMDVKIVFYALLTGIWKGSIT